MTDHTAAKVTKVAYASLAALLILSAAGLWVRFGRSYGTLIPETAPALDAVRNIPAGAVVANVQSLDNVTEPFRVDFDAASPGGLCLGLPDGHGDKVSCSGNGSFVVPVTEPGSYRLWLRCRWKDSCGNSVAVSINGGDAITVGQDAVYDRWHWVAVGEVVMTSGPQHITVWEREDGVAVDQLVLVPGEAEFVPTGMLLCDGAEARGLRRFADAFDRSPGHGNQGWDFRSGRWKIEFSLDPNRIPRQYALTGRPDGTEPAIAVVSGLPWRGATVSMAVCRDGEVAPVVGALFVSGRENVAAVIGKGDVDLPPGSTVVQASDVTLGRGQWHRLEIRRWGWTVSIRFDGREVARHDDLQTPGCGSPALLLAGAEAVFDDVKVVEIPWEAEDGKAFAIPWSSGENARWYRTTAENAPWALRAERGRIACRTDTLGIVEAVVQSVEGQSLAPIDIPHAATRDGAENILIATLDTDTPAKRLALDCDAPCRIGRVALRLADISEEEQFSIGPYHFSEAKIADPSDYLDFTPEEWRLIEASPEADKLKRKPKFVDLVGKHEQYAIWGRKQGAWKVDDGCLVGRGDGAAVRFWQHIEGPVDITMNVRVPNENAVAAVVLGASSQSGALLQMGTGDPPDSETCWARLPSAETWQEVTVRLREDQLTWRVGRSAAECRPVHRGIGGGILLEVVRREASFDDIVVTLPRRFDHNGRKSRFYAFDRRETDWVRQGMWIDHGGISCALASNWISLIAPEDEGMLIHKESFARDLLVSFNVEENTEWLGWHRNPSHVHHPFDNVVVTLAADRNADNGYRLVVNSHQRSETALYRNGEKVASVRQTGEFPIRYVGGHAPYRPRRNRVCLVRRGHTVSALINGETVLTYDDPDPLDTPTVALGGFNTRTNISRIVVRELPPDNSEPRVATNVP